MIGISIGITASRGSGGGSSPVASITITVGAQDGDNVPVSYTTDANVTCAAVLYLSTESTPTAAQFGGSGAPNYVDLGSIDLTVVGTDIELAIPDELDGAYKIALLPAGGGDNAVAESGAVTLNTVTTPVGNDIAFLIGGDSGATEQTSVKTISLDMTGHNGTDDVVVILSVYHRLTNKTLLGVTLDDNAANFSFKQAGVSNDNTVPGYAVFSAAAFADSSDLVATFSGNVWRLSCAAYSVPAGATVSTLVNQPETLRTGSDLGGDIVSGTSVIAAQTQRDGADTTDASWGDVTRNYKIDIQSNEWFHVASASNIQATTVDVTPDGGAGVQTNGLSVEVVS